MMFMAMTIKGSVIYLVIWDGSMFNNIGVTHGIWGLKSRYNQAECIM